MARKRCFNHVARAFDVDAVLRRIAPRPEARVAGDVVYGVDALGQRAQHRLPVGDVADGAFRVHALQVFQVRARPVQRDHAPALGEQGLDQVQADEAGGAGDKGVLAMGRRRQEGDEDRDAHAALARTAPLRRQAAGGMPNSRLKARLNEASDS